MEIPVPIPTINIEKYGLYDRKDTGDNDPFALLPITAVTNIRRHLERKKDGCTYEQAHIRLQTLNDSYLLKDTAEVHAELRKYFVLSEDFNTAA